MPRPLYVPPPSWPAPSSQLQPSARRSAHPYVTKQTTVFSQEADTSVELTSHCSPMTSRGYLWPPGDIYDLEGISTTSRAYLGPPGDNYNLEGIYIYIYLWPLKVIYIYLKEISTTFLLFCPHHLKRAPAGRVSFRSLWRLHGGRVQRLMT